MVDEKRILIKIDELDGYVKDLSEIVPADFQEYMDDVEARRACERLLQISIECVIKISSILVKELKTGLPADEDSLFAKLKQAKVISPDMVGILKKMKGFRNVLVHRYDEVDDKQVFSFLENNVKDFEAFKKQILNFLKK